MVHGLYGGSWENDHSTNTEVTPNRKFPERRGTRTSASHKTCRNTYGQWSGSLVTPEGLKLKSNAVNRLLCWADSVSVRPFSISPLYPPLSLHIFPLLPQLHSSIHNQEMKAIAELFRCRKYRRCSRTASMDAMLPINDILSCRLWNHRVLLHPRVC